jgi:hypothetical protein
MRLRLTPLNRRTLILAILGVPVLLGACCFLGDPGDEGFVGTSGQSFILGDQFVIVDNGYSFGKVTFVVVLNWPVSSSTEERLEDDRLIVRGVDQPQVRLPDGTYKPVEEVPHLYFFDGYELIEFPISMREDDFISFRPETMTDYSKVLEFFKRYEVGE